jgi:prefoldin subunit 5
LVPIPGKELVRGHDFRGPFSLLEVKQMETGALQLLGIVVQTILFLLAGYGMVVRTDNSVNSLKEDFKEMQKEIKSMAAVITQIAVQSVRIDAISERLNLLDSRINELTRRVDKS